MDLQGLLVTEAAAGVQMGSEEISTKMGQVALGVKDVFIDTAL